MFRIREPRPTASTPEQNCEAEKPFNQEIWAEVPGKPYAGLVPYFRNNFSEKIRLRLTRPLSGTRSLLDARNGLAVVREP
jgi:hypothetical protein